MSVPSFYNGVTVFASEADCLSDAPYVYRFLMHSLHFLTIPLYTVVIYTLIFKIPDFLREYRKYLLWHTLGNLIFELYISIFMLPVTYLPLIVSRGAGILKFWNISGLVQFWLLVTTILHTGLSVMEMFKFRFNATVQENTFNKKLLRITVFFFWIIAVFIPCLGFCIIPDGFSYQHKYKQNMWKSTPGASIEIVCHTSVCAPPPSAPVWPIIMVLFVITVLIALFIVPHTTLTMLSKLEELSKHVSKKTIEMQKMLLISLFIQAAIHLTMLGAPIGTFIYAIYFSFHNTVLTYFLILVISFHGSISTFAMTAFTKPVRMGVLRIIDQYFFHMLCRKFFGNGFIGSRKTESTIISVNCVFRDRRSHCID